MSTASGPSRRLARPARQSIAPPRKANFGLIADALQEEERGDVDDASEDVDAVLDGGQHEERAAEHQRHRRPCRECRDARAAHPAAQQDEREDPQRQLRPAHQQDRAHAGAVRQRRDRREEEPLQRRVVLPEIAIRNEPAPHPVGGAEEFDLIPDQRMEPLQLEQSRDDCDQRDAAEQRGCASSVHRRRMRRRVAGRSVRQLGIIRSFSRLFAATWRWS